MINSKLLTKVVITLIFGSRALTSMCQCIKTCFPWREPRSKVVVWVGLKKQYYAKVTSSVNFLNARDTSVKFRKPVVRHLKARAWGWTKDVLLCEKLTAEVISWKIIVQTEWSIWYCTGWSLQSLAKVDFVTRLLKIIPAH